MVTLFSSRPLLFNAYQPSGEPPRDPPTPRDPSSPRRGYTSFSAYQSSGDPSSSHPRGYTPFSHVASLLQAAGRRRDGLTVAQIMVEHGPSLTKHEVEEVIRSLQQRRDAKGTLQAFRWAKRQRWFRPNVKFYSSMMGFLAKAGEPEAAIALFQEMLLEKLTPNHYSYTALINAFGRARQYEDAIAVFEYMIHSGDPEIRPNTVTCNVLMKALCKGRRYDAVAELFLDMYHGRRGLHSDCSPSIVTYNTLLDSLCRENHLETAFDLLNDLASGRLDHSSSSPAQLAGSGGVLGGAPSMAQQTAGAGAAGSTGSAGDTGSGTGVPRVDLGSAAPGVGAAVAANGAGGDRSAAWEGDTREDDRSDVAGETGVLRGTQMGTSAVGGGEIEGAVFATPATAAEGPEGAAFAAPAIGTERLEGSRNSERGAPLPAGGVDNAFVAAGSPDTPLLSSSSDDPSGLELTGVLGMRGAGPVRDPQGHGAAPDTRSSGSSSSIADASSAPETRSSGESSSIAELSTAPDPRNSGEASTISEISSRDCSTAPGTRSGGDSSSISEISSRDMVGSRWTRKEGMVSVTIDRGAGFPKGEGTSRSGNSVASGNRQMAAGAGGDWQASGGVGVGVGVRAWGGGQYGAPSAPEPVRPNVVTFNILIDSCGKAGRVDLAERLFAMMTLPMPAGGYETGSPALSPSGATSNRRGGGGGAGGGDTAGSGYARGEGEREGSGGRVSGGKWRRSGLAADTPGTSGTFLGQGIVPDKFTYTALLDTYGRAGAVEKAEEVFEQMQREGVGQDLHAFTALLTAYSRAGVPEAIPPTLSRMRAEGLRPNEVTYLTVLDAYGKAGDPDRAEATLRDMQGAGIKPNVYSWSALIDAYGKARQLKKAAEAFRRMQEEGQCRPSPVTYAALLSACARCSKWDEALLVLYALQRSGNELEVALCRLLMSGREEGGTVWSDAVRLLTAFQKPFPREVNRSLYNTLADALWNFNMRGRAARVVQLGRQQKVHPEDRVLYGLQSTNTTSASGSGQGRRKGTGLAILGWGGGLGSGGKSGMEVEEEEDELGGVWSVDLHEHSLGSGAAFLFCWLGEIRQVWKWDQSRIPEAVEVITGWGRHRKRRDGESPGESPLKKLVEKELAMLGSPFQPLPANPGRLVATGWAVYTWLMQAEMEDWLQLRDAELPSPSGLEDA